MLSLLWFTLLVNFVTGINILLLPAYQDNHISYFSSVGEYLATEGSHNVYILICSQSAQLVKKQKSIHPITLTEEQCNGKSILNEYFTNINYNQQQKMSRSDLKADYYKLCERSNEHLSTVIEGVLTNSNLMSQLKKIEFALVDGYIGARPLYALVYKLNVRYITIEPVPNSWTAGVPSLPSVEPLVGTSTIGPQSNIFQRFLNILNYLELKNFKNQDFKHLIEEHVKERPVQTIEQTASQSNMFLVDLQPICIDYHRVELPHYRHLGSMIPNAPSNLSAPYKKFVESAKSGLVLITFGSYISDVPASILEELVKVFKAKKDIHFILRHSTKISLPKNVLASTWVPQNDILAHPNTLAFIGHASNKGQLESIYHGVPMVALPIYADQFYNAERIEANNLGVALSGLSFTSEELNDALEQIIQKKFSAKARKCSAILKSLPDPKKSILFWINHVNKFGSDHLRPFSTKLPFYKFFMMDVIAAYAFIVCFFLYICYRCCRCCCGRRRKPQHEKTD